MKLTIYKIYIPPCYSENCSAIAFTKEQAEEYCTYFNRQKHKDCFYREQIIDTTEVLELE